MTTEKDKIWRRSDDTFHLSHNGPVTNSLPPGAYELFSSIFGKYVKRIDLKSETLVNFSTGPASQVVTQINKFWNKKDTYSKMGLPYRRGILMYGPPGTGKSATIRLICEQLIKNNGLIFNVTDFELLEQFIPILNDLESTKNMVFILEDLDTLLDTQDEYTLLQILDGAKPLNDGTVFIATTNSPETISSRLIRPSRFDCLIELPASCKEVRQEYIKKLCSMANIEYREEYLDATNNFTLAETKELITATTIYDEDIDTAKERVLTYKNFKKNDDD